MVDVDKSSLQVLPLGIGDAFTATEDFTSLLLLSPETTVMVDCPDPIHRILKTTPKKAGLDLAIADINHLLLTHLHGDHVNGLEGLLYYRKFVLNLAPLKIYLSAEVADVLWDKRLAGSMEQTITSNTSESLKLHQEDFFEMIIVRPAEPFTIADMKFTVRMTQHSVPTYGFVVECQSRKFGYSCDTSFEAKHLEFLSEADLIFHDAGGGIVHASHDELMQTTQEIRKKLHLIHLSDDFDRASSQIPCVEPARLYSV